YSVLGHCSFVIYWQDNKNKKTNGAASNRPSKRSMNPPCPGNIFPESFTPKWRLSMDSTKSPSVPKIPMIRAMPAHCHFSSPPKYCSRLIATDKARITPPKKPSHVLFGEILSKSL